MAGYQDRVNLVDGSFDPLHVGHLSYFRAARSLGAPLLCNICPDSETAKKHPVLLPAADRAQILDHLDILTYVHVSERPTVDILRQLKPRAYVKGGDWVGKLPDAIGQTCDELGIRVVYTDQPSRSSTALLKQFQPDVEAFEWFVTNQRTPEPWTPVTDYSREARMPLEVPQAARIAEYMQPTSVLDYGCGFGYLLEALQAALNLPGGAIRGYDPQMPAITCRDGVLFTNQESVGPFNLVICREVLEHCPLVEWRSVIQRICDLSSQWLYITTRFNETPKHLLDIQQHDDLDPTHVTMAPKDLLRTLLVLEGFRRRWDLEEKMDWRGLNRCLVYERG